MCHSYMFHLKGTVCQILPSRAQILELQGFSSQPPSPELHWSHFFTRSRRHARQLPSQCLVPEPLLTLRNLDGTPCMLQVASLFSSTFPISRYSPNWIMDFLLEHLAHKWPLWVNAAGVKAWDTGRIILDCHGVFAQNAPQKICCDSK